MAGLAEFSVKTGEEFCPLEIPNGTPILGGLTATLAPLQSPTLGDRFNTNSAILGRSNQCNVVRRCASPTRSVVPHCLGVIEGVPRDSTR